MKRTKRSPARRRTHRSTKRLAAARKPDRRAMAALPSMTTLLAAAEGDARFAGSARAVVAALLREAVDEARQSLRRAAGRPADEAAPDVATILDRAAARLATRARERLARVVNATGVVLHTGLGRAPLPPAAVQAIAEAAGYCNLELDLDSGDRGRRGGHAERLLRELTGCEAALVVNNNAAATMLVLAALAAGREVIVSRGQLIEIGGSFRLPDVMAAGGAVLREVGTTNKTRLSDYTRAIGEHTALVMHVHTSNYRIVGFTETPATAALAELAHARRLPLYDDLGSGALLADAAWTAADEPSVVESLRAGADVVSFSGDKLLGGPQAGIVLGRREIVRRIREHPMARAVRVDKLTLAALEATLELYLWPPRALREIPTLAMLRADSAELRPRAERLAAALSTACAGESFTVAEETSYAGGGSLPAWPMQTFVVRWSPRGVSAARAAHRLRTGSLPVLARVHGGAVLFDARTIRDADVEPLASAMRRVLDGLDGAAAPLSDAAPETGDAPA